VIFDLDETLFDNSPYAAWQIGLGYNFDEQTSWKTWCNTSQSGAVPGGFEFVRFVQEAGATPIFITTRLNETRIGTARNLMNFGALTPEEFRAEERDGARPENAFKTRLFMKGMPDVQVDRPDGKLTFHLANKFMQRVFCTVVRDSEVILSIGDNLSDYAEYYGRVFDSSGSAESGKFPTIASRRASVWQDLPLFGRDFILIPNATYGGWLSAFEFNGLGASDELAATGSQVREGLQEPQETFTYDLSKTATPEGPKFSLRNLRIWEGPSPPAPKRKR
jgi:predicted secreted acid phosphatase